MRSVAADMKDFPHQQLFKKLSVLSQIQSCAWTEIPNRLQLSLTQSKAIKHFLQPWNMGKGEGGTE